MDWGDLVSVREWNNEMKGNSKVVMDEIMDWGDVCSC
jgi:hypothetical protein